MFISWTDNKAECRVIVVERKEADSQLNLNHSLVCPTVRLADTRLLLPNQIWYESDLWRATIIMSPCCAKVAGGHAFPRLGSSRLPPPSFCQASFTCNNRMVIYKNLAQTLSSFYPCPFLRLSLNRNDGGLFRQGIATIAATEIFR